MEKQFVPYELAVKLKELGFDEECISFYNQLGHLNMSRIESFNWVIRNSNSQVVKLKCVSAPLWQQVFDWFREKHYLYYSIFPLGYNVNHIQVGPLGNLLSYGNNYNYQEARKVCLEKLIEFIDDTK